MKTLWQTSLLIGLMGILAAPAISMESKEVNSAQKSSALSLAGVMSRNISSEYSAISEELKGISNGELNYQQSSNSIPSTKKKTLQNNSLGFANTGEPRTNPLRISIFQF